MDEIKQLHVNGSVHPVRVDADSRLLWVLRDDLGLTGTKYGCGEGQCGACTVLVNGLPQRSCLTPVGAVADEQITTIEGLAKNGNLHPVQEAFLKADAMQCGYCTSGMILSAVALLKRNANPTEQDIVQAMQGNLCRCGTYLRIVRAVRAAAKSTPGSTR